MPVLNITRVSPASIRYDWVHMSIPSGAILSTGPLIYTGLTFESSTLSKVWVRTPNFWQLRRSGALLPDNSFSYGREMRSGSTMLFRGDSGSTGSQRLLWTLTGSGEWWGVKPSVHSDLGITDLYSRLAQKARHSNFSLPITLIEAGRTVSMVTNVAGTLAGTIHDLRRGNLTGALRRIGLAPSSTQRHRFNRDFGRNPGSAAANAWLQYQYGWKPLLNDVKNAAETLAEAVARNGDSMTSSVSAATRLVYRQFWANYVAGVSPQVLVDVGADVKISRKAKWRFRPTSADLPGLFGLTNPMEVVWEVIPFSFVADWFLPIGNYLSALDLPLRFDHVGGSTGYRKAITWSTLPVSAEFFAGSFPKSISASGDATVFELTVTRTPLVGAPIPSISDLTFDPQINASRATSAIALLWQQASRLGR